MTGTDFITEPQRQTPIVAEVDVEPVTRADEGRVEDAALAGEAIVERAGVGAVVLVVDPDGLEVVQCIELGRGIVQSRGEITRAAIVAASRGTSARRNTTEV